MVQEEYNGLLEEFRGMEGALLPALHRLQDTYGYVDHTMHLAICDVLGIPVTETASVQSFYQYFTGKPQGRFVIQLCGRAACHVAGAEELLLSWEKALGITAGETTPDGSYTLLVAGCLGACDIAPAVKINGTIIGPVAPGQVQEILSHLEDVITEEKKIPLTEYLETGGYEALKRALTEPTDIIQQLKESGLRGRSGSGFPVGVKWETTAGVEADKKYIVCNADEGEPETAKDHKILRETPYAVLEGMTIAAAAVGAEKGYLYLRKEYEALIPVLKDAIAQATAAGYLGKHICGTDHCFEVELRLGAGAYLCGEETALLESIEGRRGRTRQKPPFPGVVGLWGKPTVINNVETLAAVSQVIRDGATAYRKQGTERCPGVKKMTISGAVNAPGVYDIPMGMKVADILRDYAGGMKDDREPVAIQTGGASGAIVTPEFLEATFDIEGAVGAGGVFGTGSLMFVPDGTDLMKLLINLEEFFVEESCGTCAPCRIGLVHMVNLLKKLEAGEETETLIDQISELAEQIRQTARCAFGTAAVTPVLSMLTNFPEVFEGKVQKGGVR